MASGAFSPFTYGFSTDPKFKASNQDKHVVEGKYDDKSEELNLSIAGTDNIVKIDLSAISSGATKEDRYVTSGRAEINEDNQKITLSIGNDVVAEKTKVDIDLSGIGETYATKTEVEESKLQWGTF